MVLNGLDLEEVMGAALSPLAVREDKVMHTEGTTGVWYGPHGGTGAMTVLGRSTSGDT